MNFCMIRQPAERAGLFAILMFATLALAACAAAPVPPTDSLSLARDAIASAEQAQARRSACAAMPQPGRERGIETHEDNEAGRHRDRERIQWQPELVHADLNPPDTVREHAEAETISRDHGEAFGTNRPQVEQQRETKHRKRVVTIGGKRERQHGAAD